MEIHFAPVQGQTDLIYRNLFQKYFGGVDCFYTPFIRMDKGVPRKKDIRELPKSVNAGVALVPQILAGNCEEFRELAQTVAEAGYDRCDINLGCPFPMIARAGKGAGMLPREKEIKELLETVREFPSISFSIKARLGYSDPDDFLHLLPFIDSLPFKHITIHPRLAVQQYKGTVDLDRFEEIYASTVHPLFYSGDIRTPKDCSDIMARFPRLKGVMLGRGLLADPFLAKEIREGSKVERDAYCTVIKAFHREFMESFAGILQGDAQLLSRMQALWSYLRVPEADSRPLKKLLKCSTLPKYNNYVASYIK